MPCIRVCINSITGLLEADTAMCLDSTGRFTLFLKPEDKHSLVWDGPRTGLSGASEIFGADDALPIADFPDFLKDIKGPIMSDLDLDRGLVEQTNLKFDRHAHAASSPKEDASISSFLLKSLRRPRAATFGMERKPLAPLIHQLRCIKSSSELEVMKIASDITAESMKDVSLAYPGTNIMLPTPR